MNSKTLEPPMDADVRREMRCKRIRYYRRLSAFIGGSLLCLSVVAQTPTPPMAPASPELDQELNRV